MKTFDFIVVLANKEDPSEDDAEKLLEGCCDDGAPGVSNRAAMVHFCRAAASFEEAIVTAKADVERASFEVARVEKALTERVEVLSLMKLRAERAESRGGENEPRCSGPSCTAGKTVCEAWVSSERNA